MWINLKKKNYYLKSRHAYSPSVKFMKEKYSDLTNGAYFWISSSTRVFKCIHKVISFDGRPSFISKQLAPCVKCDFRDYYLISWFYWAVFVICLQTNWWFLKHAPIVSWDFSKLKIFVIYFLPAFQFRFES